MDRFTERKLNLTPRTDEELHDVLSGFERKWQSKVRHLHKDGRIADF